MKISTVIFAFAIASNLALFSCKDLKSKSVEEHAHGPNGEHLDDTEGTNQVEFNVNDSSEKKEEKVAVDEQSNEATIVVKANKSLEYKFKIDQYETLTYDWQSNAPLHYDFHGDPEAKEDYAQGYFESYANGNSDHVKGKVTLPFKGSHGWYWKNESDKDVTISLTTNGNYNVIGLIQ